MKINPRIFVRPFVLLLLTSFLTYFFYIHPGFSQNLWTALYNIFSAFVLLGVVFLYSLAIFDSYEIRLINSSNSKPSEYKKWSSLWQLYEDGFLLNYRKTTVPAQTYFNPDNLLAASVERIPVLAILKAMPGTYTGLGILGTFMGFSAGLANFNTTSTESMQASITTLLTGINTAFNTSIVGVVLSITFNFLFLQPLLKRLEHDCNYLSDKLDREFYIDSIDHIKEILVFEDEGISWSPKDVNKAMLEELRSQTRSLANFTTDLSDSMKNLAEALVISYREEMRRMIAEELQPMLARLAGAADKLSEDKAQSTDQALDGIITSLNTTLNDFMKDFRENVAGQTKREMEGLALQIKTAGDTLSNLPDILAQVKTSFSLMTEQSMRALNDVTLKGSNLQNASISELAKLAEQVNQSMESFSRSLAAAEDQNRHAEKIASSFNGVADAASAVVADLSRSFKEFKEENEALTKSISKESDALRREVASVESAAKGFNGLDTILAKSFETIKNGLQEYRELTKESLEKYLASYSDSFKQFSTRLAGAVEQLQELVEDLQSSVDKIGK